MEIKNNSLVKNNLRSLGFGKEIDRVEVGLCPWCGLPVNPEDFRDDASRKESKITGMCQECIDEYFGKS
jgi:hypothetical protein